MGQVFVALKNGNSVKLGGVAVLIYQPSVVSAILSAARSNSAAARPPLDAAVRNAEAKAAKTRAASEQASKASENARTNLNLTLKRLDTNDLDFIKKALPIHAEMDKFRAREAACEKAHLESLEAVVKARTELLQHTAAAYLERTSWPTPDFKAVTDADGNFSARLPAREFVALVSASRKIGDTDEKYLWIQTISPSEPGRILFSNENLFRE